MADQALGRPKQVIHANTQANLLDDTIGVLGIDVVLDSDSAMLLELCRCNLHQIRDLGLPLYLSFSSQKESVGS